MIKLIACDMDGTLLHHGATAIDDAVLDEIRRLRGEGVLFCPASGRQYGSLRALFPGMADDFYYICENGSILYGPGEHGPVLTKVSLPRGEAVALCEDIMGTDDCEVLISGANTSYLCPKGPEVVEHIRYFVGGNLVLLSAPDEVPEDIIKVSAYCSRGVAPAVPRLFPHWQHRLNAAVSGARWLDFTPADKGAALRHLCALLDIPLAHVAAFGDNYNDVTMLDAVGHPWIMENAAEELRNRYPNHCRRVQEVLRTI